MAATQECEWPLLRVAACQIYANRHRTIVGMGPRRDVLMPLEPACAALRLYVQLGVVELHVGSDHVGRQVRHDRIAHELPKSRMLVLWTADTMQTGMLRRMPLFEYENAAGMDDAPAALQKLVIRRAQAFQPGSWHIVGQDQEAIAEIGGPLRLGKHHWPIG